MNQKTTQQVLNEVLIAAARSRELSRVQQLLQDGADIHAKNDYALRWASWDGNLEVVQLLLDNGANIHAEKDFPLRLAAEKGHVEVTTFLFNQDPDYFTNLIEQDSELSTNESLRALMNHYRLGLQSQSNTTPRLRPAL